MKPRYIRDAFDGLGDAFGLGPRMTHGIPKRGFQVHHAFRLVSMEGGEGIPGQGQVSDARFFFHLTHRSFFQALAWFELALGEVHFPLR